MSKEDHDLVLLFGCFLLLQGRHPHPYQRSLLLLPQPPKKDSDPMPGEIWLQFEILRISRFASRCEVNDFDKVYLKSRCKITINVSFNKLERQILIHLNSYEKTCKLCPYYRLTDATKRSRFPEGLARGLASQGVVGLQHNTQSDGMYYLR